MEKFTAESNYEEMVVVAIALGIAHLGVKPELLVDPLNAKIDEIGAEAATDALNAHLATITEAANNLVADPAATTTAATAKNLKWHEKEGAFSYAVDDVIEITGGKVLVGRFAVVNKPSNKNEAVKAFLFHEKTGELQATNITVDFDKIKKIGKTVTEVKAEIIAAGELKIAAIATKKEEALKAKEAVKLAKEAEKQAKITAAKAKNTPAVPVTATDAENTEANQEDAQTA